MASKKAFSKYLSIAEVAKILGISRIAVFRKVQKNQLPAERIGRAYAIPRSAVDMFMSTGDSGAMTTEKKESIHKAVTKVVDEYGETLRLLGKE